MKKILLLAGICFLVTGVFAQQEAQYTQFMYNKLALNPGYAGNAGQPCISCIHRSQWVGFNGAPMSQNISFNMPAFSQRVGLGALVAYDRIGPVNNFTTSLIYAYRPKIEKGNLSIGLRGTLRSYQIDWQSMDTTHSGDMEVPAEETFRVSPNFGTGIYYDTEKFYVGLSCPNLVNNESFHNLSTNTEDPGRMLRHFYLMGGYLFDISKQVRFKPAVLFKFVNNAPLDLDVNGTFIFMDKFWAGLSYRLGGDDTNGIGESVDLLVQYQINQAFRIGASYDYTLSKLQNHSSGTIEVQLNYCFSPKQKTDEEKIRLTNPRFF